MVDINNVFGLNPELINKIHNSDMKRQIISIQSPEKLEVNLIFLN